MEQPRWKSPVLWVAIASLIAFVTKKWIGWEIPAFDEFVDIVLVLLAAFGVTNNPVNKAGY